MTAPTQAQILDAQAKLAARCRYDPLLFAEEAWSWGVEGSTLEKEDIRVWQSEVLDDIAQHLQDPAKRHTLLRIAVASGHGIGKSSLTGMLSTWGLACHINPRILVTANSEGQLKTKTSPEIGQWVRQSVYSDLFDVDTMSIRLRQAPDQHRLDLMTNSEHQPEAFAGLHAKGRLVMVIMDEASAIPDVIWETVEGAMTDADTILLWVVLGNPTRSRGRFRECFRKHRKLWIGRQIDSRTVEGTNRQQLQDIVDQYGENSDTAKIRVRGMFPNVSQAQFIPTSYIDAAFGRHLREEQYSFAPTVISCDPAWEGDDTLVIGKRQGLRFEILETMEKNNNDMLVAAKLAHYEDRFDADAVFIDAGYGTGIASAGTTMGRNWRLVWFGGAPDDEGFKNKRAEMWARGRDWLAAGGAIPPVQRLYDDLVTVETKPHVEGRIQLQAKHEAKREGLPSPDYGDAWALTFADEVSHKLEAAKPGTTATPAAPRRAQEEYDPHA